MRAGQLNKKIEIHRAYVDRNARGEDVTRWRTAAQVWARVTQLSGDERVAAMQVHAEAKWEVELRWRSDLRTTDRIVYKTLHATHTLEIVSVVDPDERKRRLILTCSEPEADHGR